MRTHAVPNWKFTLRKAVLVLSSIMAATTFIAAPANAASTQAVSFPNSITNCDNNAVIRCGALSASDVVQAYNSDSYTQKVYQSFNISSSDIQNLPANAVAGTVTKSGNVIVDGKTVATGAMTAGRANMPGSTQITTQGITLFKRTPSVSFQQDSLDAYVVMSNNQFKFAILPSCGNPISATPVPPPKPQPQPQATAQCTSLSLNKLDTRKYQATVAFTTTGGATLKSITYDFGDNTIIPPTTDTSVIHTFQRDGSFIVRAQLAFTSSNTQPLNATCQAALTINTPPAPPTVTPTVTPISTPPSQLPSTGAGSALAVFAATTALGTGSYYLYTLRRLKHRG